MTAIDFTDLPRRKKLYGGANGSKFAVVLDGKVYMLKFPAQAKRNDNLSYANSCFSEYLGCQIFKSIGFETQNTILGTCRVNGNEKIVVACEDFTHPGVVLQDFASLKNQVVDSASGGYGTELSDILNAFQEQQIIFPQRLIEFFWDMFIVDALIGNWDRHNGNWGLLYDTTYDTMQFAPVYDCGSCLYPQADENIMRETLNDEAQRIYRIREIPTSAIKQHGRKIKYYDFITSLQEPECNEALKRIVPRINMQVIEQIVDETPFISQLQKDFYKTMLRCRKEQILDSALEKLQ